LGSLWFEKEREKIVTVPNVGRSPVNAAFMGEDKAKDNLQVMWKYFDTILQ